MRRNENGRTASRFPETQQIDIGDLAAHSRRFVAKKADLDGVRSELRVVIQELIILANIKQGGT
jgi:hypothetical protein